MQAGGFQAFDEFKPAEVGIGKDPQAGTVFSDERQQAFFFVVSERMYA